MFFVRIFFTEIDSEHELNQANKELDKMYKIAKYMKIRTQKMNLLTILH